MTRDNLPRVHGGSNRFTVSVDNTSARDDQLNQSRGTKNSQKRSGETRLCSRNMRVITRLRLVPILVLFCCVYLVYRYFGSTLYVAYFNKLGAVPPELTVFKENGGGGTVQQSGVIIENKLALQNNDDMQNVIGEEEKGAAQQQRLTGRDSLRSVVCIPLKSTSNNAKICLHDPNKDASVSKTLLDTGSWDTETVEDFKMALEKERDLGVIDIGANIGVYSLLAAYMGRHVVAVDACHHTLLHLKKSVEINYYTDRVSIVEAAVMESRGYAKMTIPEGDYGSAFPSLVSKDSFNQSEVDDHKIVKAIKLEDIVEYVKVPRVILKVDIGGEDYSILKDAKRLFDVRDIKYIFVIFSPEKGTQVGKTLGVRFLQERGYVPKRSIMDKELFIGLNGDERPSHIVWEKQYGR